MRVSRKRRILKAAVAAACACSLATPRGMAVAVFTLGDFSSDYINVVNGTIYSCYLTYLSGGPCNGSSNYYSGISVLFHDTVNSCIYDATNGGVNCNVQTEDEAPVSIACGNSASRIYAFQQTFVAKCSCSSGNAQFNYSSGKCECNNTSTCSVGWGPVNSYNVRVQYNYSWDAGGCLCAQGAATGNYSCAAGYYGNPTSASGTCTRCPEMTDTGGIIRYGTSTVGSNTAVSSCVMSNTYTFPDAGVGDYRFQIGCNAS